jgi:hypothetical protein
MRHSWIWQLMFPRGSEFVGETIILKWRIRMGSCGLHSSRSGQGPVAGSCEHGNEP